MTISRKPKPSLEVSSEKQILKEKEIENLIHKGGSIASPANSSKGKDDPQKNVQLRLLGSWLDRIDTLRNQRAVKTPRHTWFLEAISEKLEKEETKYKT
ncbi:MAG: hypothetical protein NPINA01_32020 [Nitrospinaceae bacterium]|jgi:hypothetical protein|nr:MAG: hypothetical protein NPINA01_32020 [Nitrospinaceae bacterium]